MKKITTLMVCRRLVVFGTGTGARPAFRPGRQIPDRTVHRRASRPRHALPPGAGGKNHRSDALHPRCGASRPGGLHGRRGDGKPAAQAWHRVLEPVAERNLPFCVVLGNHDAEQDLTRAEIGRIVTSYAGTLNTLGAGGELADMVLEIAGTKKPAALLYCLDSHDYSTNPVYRRLRLVYSGAGGLVSCPQRRLYRGQRREAAAGAGVFPYRPARIRRCMAEPRQYACRPCRRG